MPLTPEQVAAIKAEKDRIGRVAGEEAAFKYAQAVVQNAQAEGERLIPTKVDAPPTDDKDKTTAFGYNFGHD